MKRLLILGICILLIVAGIAGCMLFLIGEPIDGNQLLYTTEAEGNMLSLDIYAVESATALRGWKYRQEGDVLYISARKVLVSPLNPSGEYHTTIDVALVKEIYLGGERIWSAGGR